MGAGDSLGHGGQGFVDLAVIFQSRGALLLIGLLLGRLPASGESGSNNGVDKEGASSVLEFIETDFENASLVWYEVATDVICSATVPIAESRALIIERQ